MMERSIDKCAAYGSLRTCGDCKDQSPTRRHFTQEEKNLIRKMRAEGMPVKEIAAVVGRSVNSVCHQLYDKSEHFVPAVERGRKLNDDELQWVIAHYANTTNANIQRRFGISYSCLHRTARKYGLVKSKKFMKKMQAAAQRAASESHIANGTYPPKGFIVPKSEQYRFKKGETTEMRIGKAKDRERIRKSAETLALRRRREKALVFCGLPQKTKLRVTMDSSSKVSYRRGLRKCGYEQDQNDRDLFFYPENGERHPRRERNGAKHGIRFRHKDESKVYVEDLHFASVDDLFPAEKKPQRAEVVAAFGKYPVGSKIVRDLSAYNNDNSFLYDQK